MSRRVHVHGQLDSGGHSCASLVLSEMASRRRWAVNSKTTFESCLQKCPSTSVHPAVFDPPICCIGQLGWTNLRHVRTRVQGMHTQGARALRTLYPPWLEKYTAAEKRSTWREGPEGAAYYARCRSDETYDACIKLTCAHPTPDNGNAHSQLTCCGEEPRACKVTEWTGFVCEGTGTLAGCARSRIHAGGVLGVQGESEQSGGDSASHSEAEVG